MCSELHTKIGKREETVCIVETLLVFTVAALHFAIVSGRVGANELVPDPQFGGSGFKESRQMPFAVRKTIGEFKTVVRLDALHPDAPARIPFEQPF